MHQPHASQNVNTSHAHQQKSMHSNVNKTAQSSSNGSHMSHPKHPNQIHPHSQSHHNRPQHPPSNLNKSLPVNQPAHKPGPVSHTLTKHPSSSQINPNKING